MSIAHESSPKKKPVDARYLTLLSAFLFLLNHYLKQSRSVRQLPSVITFVESEETVETEETITEEKSNRFFKFLSGVTTKVFSRKHDVAAPMKQCQVSVVPKKQRRVSVVPKKQRRVSVVPKKQRRVSASVSAREEIFKLRDEIREHLNLSTFTEVYRHQLAFIFFDVTQRYRGEYSKERVIHDLCSNDLLLEACSEEEREILLRYNLDRKVSLPDKDTVPGNLLRKILGVPN
jgi:hypothetical protein